MFPDTISRSKCVAGNMRIKYNTAIVSQAACTLLVTMSSNDHVPSVSCGCDCEPQDTSVGDAGCENDWARCECIRCGGGRCNVLVHSIVKVAWIAFKLGHELITPSEIDAAPRYCGRCIDHHHCRKIEQDALHRK